MSSGIRSAIRSVDDYIKGFPGEVQRRLQKMRLTVRKGAPGAEEKISYGIPAFFLDGALVYFAAFQNHIGFYPRASGITKFKKELSAYKGAKGSVRFPFDKPIPFHLVTRIVKFRVKENCQRAQKAREKNSAAR